MTMSHITYLSIYYAGVCSGLLLFALILIALLAGNTVNNIKAGVAGICEWAAQKDRYIVIFAAICTTALIAMGFTFQEPPRSVLPESPEIGRYLLSDSLGRIAEFNSKADCQFAKHSIWASHLKGKHLGERLICTYLGSELAAPQ